MFALTAFLLAFPSSITVSALTLKNPSSILSGSATANLTNSHYIHECLGNEYGYNLDSAGCADALSQIDASSTTEQTYGPRFKGPFDVKLPKRYISSNGRCIIEPHVVRGELSARASLQQVASAASYIIDQCVEATQSQGGGVRDIGGDNNLFIIVKKYEGPTECSGTVSPTLLSSCQNIVDTMPVSEDFTTWGPADDPLAVMKLPLAYYSHGHTDTFARYQFWTVAAALTGVCVRGGQMGARDRLGLSGHLIMEIGPA